MTDISIPRILENIQDGVMENSWIVQKNEFAIYI